MIYTQVILYLHLLKSTFILLCCISFHELSVDIYTFSPFRHEGTDSQSDLGDIIVVLNSFRSKILEIQVCEAELSGGLVVNIKIYLIFN